MSKPVPEAPRYNPFWVCLLVFLALGVDSGLRCAALMNQRQQIREAQFAQPENITKLAQLNQDRAQTETVLQAFSLDLLQVAQTNAIARQIVQEFSIQWTPPAK